MNNYLGVTDLELDLLSKISSLIAKIREQNKFLEKANGYGCGNVRYDDIIKSLKPVLSERKKFTGVFISKEDFENKFSFRKDNMGAEEKEFLLLDELGRLPLAITEEKIKFINSSFGKKFNISIDNDGRKFAYFLDFDFYLPVSLFSDICLSSVPQFGKFKIIEHGRFSKINLNKE